MIPTLYMRYPGGKARALTLSYDDGVEQDIPLLEIMARHGLKGTFNLNSDLFAPEGAVYPAGQIHRRMSLAAAKGLYLQSGQEIGFHGMSHPYMEDLTPNRQLWELMGDRERLENEFGMLVRGGAYPFGTYSDELVNGLRAGGTAYCRTVRSTRTFEIPRDWLRLNPTCHHNDPELMGLGERFLNDPVERKPLFFYLWGHSYEFEQKNNWAVIENFAALVGNRDDVYYATNIELYDYVEAFRGLRFSCNGSFVENPWAIPVWFTCNGEPRKLEAGQQMQLI
ncbi:MAG: polysaccharide deacetylase family protein [Eubacteriales bacterium]|nr:polysaccharide deacetylase family protein [Eubacteriales bacterium]